MRSALIALILAASALLPAAAGAGTQECLPSPQAVRAIHGQGAWSAYHTVNGHRCYFLSEKHTRQAARTPVQRQRPAITPPSPHVPAEQERWPVTTEIQDTPQALINRAFAALGVR